MAVRVLTPAVAGTFQATLFPTTGQNIAVSQFTSRTAPTPGNVAVCLSGGGSRALCAGMGQLQALEAVQLNGASMLSQVKAVSTVSGGSWVGVPFVYLTPGTGDSNYLGTFVNPSQLSPAGVSSLPNGNIGSQVTAFFSIEDIAISALVLYLIGEGRLAPNMLWQSVIGLHMLAPYGLYSIASLIPPDFTPDSYFTSDSAAQELIVKSNPALSGETGNLVSTASGETRPYLVCNMAMFVNVDGQTLLAPVQATPAMTGIVSTPPNAQDANGRQVGGGGVTSFAFSSAPASVSGNSVTVSQARQMSLVDIVGTSSAAFAVSFEEITAPLVQQLSQWQADLQAARLSSILPALARVGQYMDGLLHQASAKGELIRTNKYLVAARALAIMPAAELAAPAPVLPAGVGGILDDILKAIVEILNALIPEYDYWPVLNAPAGQSVNPTQFADGGSLENSGIAAMLVYSDINNIISFTNTVTPLSQQTVYQNGQQETVIVVDDSIPPLFGYQPFQEGIGYVLYSAGGATGSNVMFQNNQVFPSDSFQDLLNGLWAASGSFQKCPVFKQQLTTVGNNWFGVPAGKTVSVLWNYLERCQTWFGSLPQSVQSLVPQNFPHYNTILETQLSPAQVNLLANLTAWNIVVENTSLFEGMFG